MLQILQLFKKYNELAPYALDNISFDVQEGELLALVGESGSGKSSLLRIVAGLEEPDAGEVRLLGKKVVGPAHRLVAGHPDIKLVHQDYQLMPRHTIWENIAYPLRTYRQTYQYERVGELLERFRLSAYAQKLPAELSGGEQQRVALARSLAEIPALLLLDEPLSNLDLANKNIIHQEISSLIRENGTTALWVTHDAQEALAYPDRLVLMRQGKIQQTGTPERIYKQPETLYAAQFFGRCNFLIINELQEIWPDIQLDLSPEMTTVCIRYEQIGIHTSPQPNCAEVTVKNVRYLGHSSEVDVVCSNKCVLTTEYPFAVIGKKYYISLKISNLIIL